MITATRTMAHEPPLEQAKRALGHILRRIKEDERIAWYMGIGTESFAAATEAYATLTGEPVLAVRQAFAPKRAKDPACAVAETLPCLSDEEVSLLRAVAYYLDGQCSKTCLEAAHDKEHRGFELLTMAARQGSWAGELEDLANKRISSK